LADSVDATFTIQRDEYVRAIRRHYRSQLKVTRDIVGGLIAMSVGFYLLQKTEQSAIAWLLILSGAILLTMVAYALLILPVMLYRTQPKLQSEYRLHFDDNGIGFDTTDIRAQLNWKMYHSWLSDEEFFILYHGTRQLSVIPKRSMTEDGCKQLTTLLKRNIGTGLEQ
jgi:hypothetical protein